MDTVDDDTGNDGKRLLTLKVKWLTAGSRAVNITLIDFSLPILRVSFPWWTHEEPEEQQEVLDQYYHPEVQDQVRLLNTEQLLRIFYMIGLQKQCLMTSGTVGCIFGSISEITCRCTGHALYHLNTPTKLHRISLLGCHHVIRCSAQTKHSIPQTLTHKLNHFTSCDSKKHHQSS